METNLETPKNTAIWNGELFAEKYCNTFRYLTDRKVWLMWDGARWRDAEEGALVRAAEEIVKTLFAIAMTYPPGDDRDTAFGWAIRSAGRNGISEMIYFASCSAALAMQRKQFDQHPNLLNVANGTIDLGSGKIRPHEREDYLTTITPINYN